MQYTLYILVWYDDDGIRKSHHNKIRYIWDYNGVFVLRRDNRIK